MKESKKKWLALKLMAPILFFCFVVGCGQKTPETAPHVEKGPLIDIVTQVSDDCAKNKDVQGAQDAWDTFSCLLAFGCPSGAEVKYDDVKNRNFENIEYSTGDLLIAVAAYNEYNDESATDVDVDWILHYSSCTQEQLDAIDAYVDWYHTQNGNVQIEDFRGLVARKYDEILQKYDITNTPPYDRLTPDQFKEVYNYMKDPEYQIDTTVWE